MSLCTVKKSWWDPSTVAAVPWFLSWVFEQLAVETMVRQLPMHLPHMQRGAGCKTCPLTLPFHPPSSHRSLSLWRCHTGVLIQKVMHRKRYLSNYRQTITSVKIVSSNKFIVTCNIAGFTHISWLMANLSLLISWYLQSAVFTIQSASTAKRNMPNYQCDQIVAETPNRDVLEVQMSMIFGKCRLAFFVTFKPKMAFFLAFLIFGRFYPILASFLQKIIHFPT